MNDYELKVKENEKRNKKYQKEFEVWLKGKKLGEKTIRKHLSNVDLYINDYLTYYEITKMEDGIAKIDSFLDGWFIEKCLWASKTSIKETAASIKKFYQCMSEKKHVNKEDYTFLCQEIKNNMDIYLDNLEEYDNSIDDDWFF